MCCRWGRGRPSTTPGGCTPGWCGGRSNAASTRAGTCTRSSWSPGTPRPTRSSGPRCRPRPDGWPPTWTGPTPGCSTNRRRRVPWPPLCCAGWTAVRWTTTKFWRRGDRSGQSWIGLQAGGLGDPERLPFVARPARVPRRAPHERATMTALPVAACPTEAELEFDRQIDALVMTGLPDRLELAETCFRASLEPLRDLLPPVDGDSNGLPFVVVV